MADSAMRSDLPPRDPGFPEGVRRPRAPQPATRRRSAARATGNPRSGRVSRLGLLECDEEEIALRFFVVRSPCGAVEGARAAGALPEVRLQVSAVERRGGDGA